MKSAHIVSLFPVIGAAFLVVLAFALLKQLGLIAFKLGWALRGVFNAYRYYPVLAYPSVEVEVEVVVTEVKQVKLEPVEEPTSPPNIHKVENNIEALDTPRGAGEKRLPDYTYRELRAIAKELNVRQKVDGRDLNKRELILAIENARFREAVSLPTLIAA